MVYARTKLIIGDDHYAPVKKLTMNYTGAHPEKFYSKVKDFITTILKVPEENVQEATYTWETAAEKNKFEFKWDINKEYDNLTTVRIEIKLKGFSDDNKGSATIEMKPTLLTGYPQDTIWEQSFVYEIFRRIWHVLFYHNKRMTYMTEGRKMCSSFMDELKNFAEELRHGRA